MTKAAVGFDPSDGSFLLALPGRSILMAVLYESEDLRRLITNLAAHFDMGKNRFYSGRVVSNPTHSYLEKCGDFGGVYQYIHCDS